MALTNFTNGTLIKSSEMNANFDLVMEYLKKTVMAFHEPNDWSAHTGSYDVLSAIGKDTAIGIDASGNIDKSIDGGSNWVTKQTGLNATIDELHLNPSNATYMIAFNKTDADDGAWYSLDAGETWTQISTLPTGSNWARCAWSVTNTGRVYLLVYDTATNNNEIHYTDNDGTLWTSLGNRMDATTPTDLSIWSPADGYVVYHIEESGDNGAGWTINNGGAWTADNNESNTIQLVVHFVDTNNYYFRINGGATGAHTLIWQGNTISDDDFAELESSGSFAYPIVFSATEMVSIATDVDFDSIGRLMRKDTDSLDWILPTMGMDGTGNTASLQKFLGINGEPMIAKDSAGRYGTTASSFNQGSNLFTVYNPENV